jgi:DNA-binding NtrC family response regulator
MKTLSLLLSLSFPQTISASSGGKQVHAPTNGPGSTVVYSGLSVPANLPNSITVQDLSVFSNSLVLPDAQTSPSPQLPTTVNPYQGVELYAPPEHAIHSVGANLEPVQISGIPASSPDTVTLPPVSPEAGLAGVINSLEQLRTQTDEVAEGGASPLLRQGLQTARKLLLEAAAKFGVHLGEDKVGAEVKAGPRRKRPTDPQVEIIAEDPEMLRVLDWVQKFAPMTGAVLITGETGTGKELIARAFHRSSGRSGEFVAVNAAALPENLIESEFFGHVKGAFTGAGNPRIGRFEHANGGTLFLDEIGEMTSEQQAVFLRVLPEEGTATFTPVGSNEIRTSNVRIVAATNVDLAQAIKDGKFRRDVYHRLNAFPIAIPPLRKRQKDILPLAKLFLRKHAEKYGQEKQLSPEAEALLLEYNWPGNVRELRNVMDSAAISATGDIIGPTDLRLGSEEPQEPEPPTGPVIPPGYRLDMTLEELEAWHITNVLRYEEWKKMPAAKSLKIERSTLDRKIKKHDIKRP